jgi:ubiquinone/menaquinone biosynthesis C-methylase UbiE
MQSKTSIAQSDRTIRSDGDNDSIDQPQLTERRPLSTPEIAEAYSEVADSLARWRRLDRLFAGRYRRRQFGDVNGRVLDVACGTGENFQYLPAPTDVVGIDISDAMLAHASDELDRVGLDGSVRLMNAQSLALPNDSFDTVISSFSSCTFPDSVTALDEMARVCRPAGQIRLLEHSRSTVTPIGWIQDWRAESHYRTAGCRLNHEPLQTVRSANLSVENTGKHCFGLVVTIDATPEVNHA